jgi:hypothetical protein
MNPSQVHLLSMVDRPAVLTRNELWREVVSVPASDAALLKYFQRLMRYGLVVPDDP